MSVALNLELQDAADDIVLNQIIWKRVRGPDSKTPSAVRAGSILPSDDEREK